MEPFGYFKSEPFGWTDCSEDDEGAVPLYEHPHQDIVRDAARYRYLRSESRRDALDLNGPAAGCWIDSEDEHHNLIMLTGVDADEAIDNAMEE